VQRVLQVLAEAGRPLSTAELEPLVDLRRGRLEMMLKVLDVDGAVRRVKGGWSSTGQPWVYDTARLTRVAATRQAEQDSMLAYAATAGCRMLFLREALDDPAAAACGRCDRCARPLFGAAVSEPLGARHRRLSFAVAGPWAAGYSCFYPSCRSQRDNGRLPRDHRGVPAITAVTA
jgi:ATP-dependent DNA helicase RecQ